MILRFLKTQLGFDFKQPVKNPGSHGSTKWWYDVHGQVQYGDRPAPAAPTAPTAPSRPQHARTYEEGARDWEVLLPAYQAKARTRERARLEGNIAWYRQQLDKMTPRMAQKRREYEVAVRLWQADLEALNRSDPEVIARIEAHAAAHYAATVKAAISKGLPVPLEVVAQSVEFRTTLDGRQRYEKGRHTSFANVSAAINTGELGTRGYKTKRQDGTAITVAQREEIAEAVSDVESVLGPLKDLMTANALTIAHTNGKQPFMRASAGALYSSGERTISIGMEKCRALAHEMGHWLDFEAGAAKGIKRIVWHGRNPVKTTSLAEAEKWDGGPGGQLLQEATRRINATQVVIDTLRQRLNATRDPVERERITLTKTLLGPYWKEPSEVWARLVEQYVATKLGRLSAAADSPEAYGARPGWWTTEDFARFVPAIEHEIARRLDAMREGLHLPKVAMPLAAPPTASTPPPPSPPPSTPPTGQEPVLRRPPYGWRSTGPLEIGQVVYALDDSQGAMRVRYLRGTVNKIMGGGNPVPMVGVTFPDGRGIYRRSLLWAQP